MASSKKTVRQSLAFSTPQANRKSSALSRRSLSNLALDDNDKGADETLFSTLMNDPLKKAILLQFLSNKTPDADIIDMMKRKAKQDKEINKKATHFSPIAVHRRRALAAMHAAKESSDNSPSQKTYPRSAIPFSRLLQGVIAYVEIISNNENRSAGVKAILKTMGAKVSDKIHRGITHAIIKDVCYDTYSKANMVKAHLVSVLWLEAVRKNHCRVPEKDYPALGLEADRSSVSLLCEKLQKDYTDVVKDELERSRNLQRTIKHNLSSRFCEDVINTSQECDMDSMISGIRSGGQKSSVQEDVDDRQSQSIPPKSPSDTESEIGLVNGEIMQKRDDHNLTESSGALEHSIVNCIVDKLKDFSDSGSSYSSRNTSPVKKASKGSVANKRQNSETKENLGTSENISNDSQQRKLKPSLEKNESQDLEVLSELHVSNTRRSSRNKNTSSNAVQQLSDLTSLRVSDGSSKGRTTKSSILSSLRISTDSSKPEGEQPAASEPVPSLRISSGSSKRRTTESSVLSSLRISTDSSKSKKNSLESNLAKEVPDLNIGDGLNLDEEKVKTPNNGKGDPYINVTERKKKTAAPAISDGSVQESLPKTGTVKKKIEKLKKRKLYDPNDLDAHLEAQAIHVNDRSKETAKKNIDIAPVLMTPNAKKAIKKKLPNISDSDIEDSEGTKPNGTPSPSKKTKTLLDEHKFKTPRNPVKAKKAHTQSERKQQPTPSRRLTRSNSSLDNALSQKNRRSTLDFVPKDSFKTPIKTKSPHVKPKKLTSIVCSRFHTNEVEVFNQIVRKLGMFFVEDEVSDKTSHLVLAEPKRTVNLLRALARGCWVLKSEWLYKSLEEGKWMPEEEYEMTEYSSAVQKSRQQRQAFGRSYSMDVFSNCGNIYIAKSSNPRCSDLQELVKTCRGRVTTTHRNAAVIVGEFVEGEATCVSVSWLLDCISFYKTQSRNKYLLEAPAMSRRNSVSC